MLINIHYSIIPTVHPCSHYPSLYSICLVLKSLLVFFLPLVLPLSDLFIILLPEWSSKNQLFSVTFIDILSGRMN